MANLRVDKITSTETFETTGSVQFDGTGDYLDVTESNNDFDFDGDFTIEFWVYFNTVNTRNDTVGSANNSVYLGASKSGWIASYYTLGGNKWHFSYQSNQAWIFEHTFSFTSESSRWYHVAFTREDSSIKCFVDGVQQGATKTSSTTLTSTENSVRVGGGEGSTSLLLNGHISNVRIIKGTALYTSNFKPPMRELEVTPETVLLACQSKTDATLEKTGKTITANGNAVANELTPGILTPIVKSGGGSAITGSVEFSGAPAATVGTDYLNVSSTDFAFGTSDFSVEMWFNSGDVSAEGQRGLIQLSDTVGGLKTDYTSGFVIATGVNNAGNASVNDIYSQILGDNLGSNDDPLRNDTWHHVALTRQSGTARLFLNGVLLGSSSAAESISAEHLVIGGWYSTSYLHKGFISNLRIVRGTALYTADFIPPTRELKNVPGTVLLCCQDPNNPLTEVTGKTITGYGNLQRADDVDLITNGSFGSDVSNWTATDCTLSYSSGQMQITRSGGGGLTANQAFTTVAGKTYILSGTINSSGSRGDLRVYNGSGTGGSMIVSLTGTNGAVTDLRGTFIASSTTSTVVIAIDDDSTSVTVDNISVTLAEGSNKGSNFTPQVGDDRQVTFEGVTKINTDAYFYLPTGDTITRESRSGYGNRGLFSLGAAPSASNTIEFVTISSTGDATNFGDLTTTIDGSNASCSSSTRGIFAGGRTDPANINVINFVTIASIGDAIDFGDLTEIRRGITGHSSSIRGVFAGGRADPGPNPTDVIDFITIASTGNAADFGNLSVARRYAGSTSSSTRGLVAGGADPGKLNTIDYVTIPSTGNALDFGDLTNTRDQTEGNSNGVRGIFGGGGSHPTYYNIIDYVTIASTGNAKDFGDLLNNIADCASASNCIRGVFAGGHNPSKVNTIQYVTIPSMGNALDFGNLTTTSAEGSGCSDSHGGLG